MEGDTTNLLYHLVQFPSFLSFEGTEIYISAKPFSSIGILVQLKELILSSCSVDFVQSLCPVIGGGGLSNLTTLHLNDMKSPHLLIEILPQLQELALIGCQIEPSNSMRKAIHGLTGLRSLRVLDCSLLIADASMIFPLQVGSKVMTTFEFDAQSFMCLKPVLSPILSHISQLCLF